MQKLTVYSIVQEIAGVPVQPFPSSLDAPQSGAMMLAVMETVPHFEGLYVVDEDLILHSDPENNCPESLAVAAHEAFHAKRQHEGTGIRLWEGWHLEEEGIRDNAEEEIRVDDLAKQWLRSRMDEATWMRAYDYLQEHTQRMEAELESVN